MKKIISLFLLFLCPLLAGTAFAVSESAVNSAGKKVSVMEDAYTRNYLASRFNFSKKILTVGFRCGQTYQCSAEHKPMQKQVISLLQNAFNEWIASANKKLDAKSQIPFFSIVESSSNQPDLLVQLRFTSLRVFFDGKNAIGQGGLWTSGAMGFIVLQYPYEWSEIVKKDLSVSQDPSREIKAGQKQLEANVKTQEELVAIYQDEIAGISGGFDLKDLQAKEPEIYQQLVSHADWVNKMPDVLAKTYQLVVTHELGHVLGLGHTEDAAQSVMHTSYQTESQDAVSESDGDNLAALYCYYGNMRAAKQGKKPLLKMAQAAKRQEDKETVQREVESGTQNLRDKLTAEQAARQPAAAVGYGAGEKPISSNTPVSAGTSGAGGVALLKPLPDAIKPSVASPDSAALADKVKETNKKELDSFIGRNRSALLSAVQKDKAGVALSPVEVSLLKQYNALYGQYTQRVPHPREMAARNSIAAPKPILPPAVTLPVKPQEQTNLATDMKPVVQAHKCIVCGREILSSSDEYQATSSRFVHKHSQCAYQYFAQRHATDAEALASYDAYYFLSTPGNVTAAKGLMRDLGLSVADIKNYAGVSAAQIVQQKTQMEAATAEREAKAAAEKERPALYQTVTNEDVQNFIRQNSVVLNTLRRKQKAGQTLNKKERLVWQNYQQLVNNQKLTQQYQSR